MNVDAGGSKTCKKGTKCPANGKQCGKCGKMNHFSRACRTRGKTEDCGQLESSDDSSDEDCCRVETQEPKNKKKKIKAFSKKVSLKNKNKERIRSMKEDIQEKERQVRKKEDKQIPLSKINSSEEKRKSKKEKITVKKLDSSIIRL